MLLLTGVALNASLIGCCLLRPLLTRMYRLRVDLLRSLRYLRHPLSATRERAFRARTLELMWTLAGVLGQLASIALCYAPSLLLAHYQSHWSEALFSGEALTGMILAALFCGWRLTRS
jgi:hypothetical protein